MKSFVKALKRFVFLAGLAALIYGAWVTPAPRQPLAARSGPAVQDARSWGYQLQNALPDRIAAGIDVLVIDSQRYREPHATLSPEMVARFKSRPDGRQRLVFAYLSVGEAESYRYYWRPHWSLFKPGFIGPENADWSKNFRVRYWDKHWQTILFQPERSLFDALLERVTEARTAYLDRIIDAGFDGVYLDRVDVFQEWTKERPTAEADMIGLVGAISAYAKARRPGFLIMPQNAEELLQHAHYRRTIDAIGKEDLYFGIDHKEGENAADDVAASVRLLSRARADKIPVFVVEYVSASDKRARAEARARERGFVLQFAARQLNRPPEFLPPPSQPAMPAPVAPGPSAPASVAPPAAEPRKKP
jgi:cysteinyl-tRNA synthetase, unknown class